MYDNKNMRQKKYWIFTFRAEAVLSMLHTHLHFVAVLNSQMKNWKEKSSDAARATLYEAYRQIHFSEAQCAYIPGKD